MLEINWRICININNIKFPNFPWYFCKINVDYSASWHTFILSQWVLNHKDVFWKTTVKSIALFNYMNIPERRLHVACFVYWCIIIIANKCSADWITVNLFETECMYRVKHIWLHGRFQDHWSFSNYFHHYIPQHLYKSMKA